MPTDLTRSRDFSEQFLTWARGKGRILIVAHDNPDPDSLAAAMALKHLFLKKIGQSATIGYGGIIGRGENRVMVQKLEIDAIPIDQLDLDDFQVVCMVDTQPGTGNNSYPKDRPVHLVIDHHPAKDICTSCRWVDIRADYGAAATILFEYLQAQQVTFGTKLATILFYAIKSETQDLGREWCQADRSAYLQLLPLANNRILFDILHPQVPRAYFASFSKAIHSARVYGDVLIFNLLEIDNPDIVAEFAELFMRTEGIVVVLGMGCFEPREVLSFRTRLHNLHAGDIMRTVVAGLGTAGGHGMMAGGQIEQQSADWASQRALEQTLTKRLLAALNRPLVKGKRLVPAP